MKSLMTDWSWWLYLALMVAFATAADNAYRHHGHFIRWLLVFWMLSKAGDEAARIDDK